MCSGTDPLNTHWQISLVEVFEFDVGYKYFLGVLASFPFRETILPVFLQAYILELPYLLKQQKAITSTDPGNISGIINVNKGFFIAFLKLLRQEHK